MKRIKHSSISPMDNPEKYRSTLRKLGYRMLSTYNFHQQTKRVMSFAIALAKEVYVLRCKEGVLDSYGNEDRAYRERERHNRDTGHNAQVYKITKSK
ncbi:hypothetical protein SAMN05660226_02296 [Parapedobacter luteus]|uniref:Uncharacterized protein n=1 Tax=Parapedobacter luteus TaxID=623280 RepID=A0A1T5CSE1_9SPHI|nr:hypothetical protein [Parapedobacter luteus]SKB62389.1 hypothetical protein SAMN05660226_02296 [Parapedobacter luteus]